ncbi:hypothetical protein HYW42_00800 [Candidatus Daviesbacteria bacterium]|nr:hypothetical protein [Candidatus Daviesbacteria bacterium]
MNNLSEDLKEFLRWIKMQSDEYINEHQELILVMLRLITDTQFQFEIQKLRSEYNLPKKWYLGTKNVDFYKKIHKEYEAWHKRNTKEVLTKDHPKILEICKQFRIDSSRYGFFVSNYLYFRDLRPLKPLTNNTFLSNEEYRYKARLETAQDETMPYLTKGYIRFFQDTTPEQLLRFVEENKDKIRLIRSWLPLYPHTKKFSLFKRDIQIFILHLLNYKTPKISDIIAEENLSQDENSNIDSIENKFTLEEAAIREIVRDLTHRIKNLKNII